ncbi:hypothetical protein CsSME_00010822 [Camellia sinensis var. sinensis]
MSVDLESLSEATSGAIGALVSTAILYPLDTCKTKYQAEVRVHGQHKYSGDGKISGRGVVAIFFGVWYVRKRNSNRKRLL